MEHTLAYYITALYRGFLDYTTQELQALGLRCGQLPFLLYVGKHPGCTPSQLKGDLGLDWGYTQRCLMKLVKDGFLIRAHAEGNSRVYHLTLTDRGQEAFDRSHQVFQEWDDAQLGPLSPEQRQQLCQLLSPLTQDLPFPPKIFNP